MLPQINICALLLTIWFRRFLRALPIFQTPPVNATPYTLYLVPPVVLLSGFVCYLTRNNRGRWLDCFNATLMPVSVDRESENRNQNEGENRNENETIMVENRIKKVKRWVDSNLQHSGNSQDAHSQISHNISIASSRQEAQPSTSGGCRANERVTHAVAGHTYSYPAEHQRVFKVPAKRRNRNTISRPLTTCNAGLKITKLPSVTKKISAFTSGSSNSQNVQPHINNTSQEINGDSSPPKKILKYQKSSDRPEMASSLSQQPNHCTPIIAVQKYYHGLTRRGWLIRRTRSGKVYGFFDHRNKKK